MTALHVRVRAGGEEYALSVRDVIEVAEVGRVTPVPGAPPAVVGVRNLRGAVLPVRDLAGMLGVPQPPSSRRIVVAEQGHLRAGLAVDSVIGVEELPPATETADSRHVLGAVLADGALIGIVDVGSVLSSAQEALR